MTSFVSLICRRNTINLLALLTLNMRPSDVSIQSRWISPMLTVRIPNELLSLWPTQLPRFAAEEGIARVKSESILRRYRTEGLGMSQVAGQIRVTTF